MKNLKYQEPEFYSISFDESEEDPFEVPPGRTNFGVVIKPVPGYSRLYLLQDRKGDFLLCSSLSLFYLLGGKLQQFFLNMILYPWLNEMIGLKLPLMWHCIMRERRSNHHENYHIKYLSNNMDMIHCLVYLHFQHELSWHHLLMVSNIVLQLSESGCLTEILCFVLPLTCNAIN